MLTLGIPANPVMALMIGAMIIQGIVPGPNVATEQPALFWGIIASMWIGNLMLIVLNLPLIGLWVRLLTVPYYLLFPTIMAFCSIGVYRVDTNAYDLYAVAFFGLLGYVLVKLRCEPAPLLLGFVLGPLLEENLRRAMILSRGDPTTFVTRPISAVLLVMALAVLVVVFLPAVRKKREEVSSRRNEGASCFARFTSQGRGLALPLALTAQVQRMFTRCQQPVEDKHAPAPQAPRPDAVRPAARLASRPPRSAGRRCPNRPPCRRRPRAAMRRSTASRCTTPCTAPAIRSC